MKKVFSFLVFICVSVASFSQVDTTRTATPLDGKGVWIQVSSGMFSSLGYVNDSTRGLIKSGAYFIRQVTSDGTWPVEYGGVSSSNSAATNSAKLQLLIDRSYTGTIIFGTDSLKTYALSGTINTRGKSISILPGTKISGTVNFTGGGILSAPKSIEVFTGLGVTFNGVTANDGYWSPVWWGAKLDSTATNVNIFNHTATQAAANKGSVYFPDGKYYFNGIINLMSNSNWVFDLNAKMYAVKGSRFTNSADVENLTINGLKVFLVGAGTGGSNFFFISTTGDSTLMPNRNIKVLNSNFEFDRAGNFGFLIVAAKNVEVNNVYTNRSNNKGISFAYIEGLKVLNCFAENSGRSGICLNSDINQFSLIGNKIKGWMQTHDLFDGGMDFYELRIKNGQVLNNVFITDTNQFNKNEPKTIGLRIQCSDNVQVSDNEFYMYSQYNLHAMRVATTEPGVQFNTKGVFGGNNKIFFAANWSAGVYNIQGSSYFQMTQDFVDIHDTTRTPGGTNCLMRISQSPYMDTTGPVNLLNTIINWRGKGGNMYVITTPTRSVTFNGSVDSLGGNFINNSFGTALSINLSNSFIRVAPSKTSSIFQANSNNPYWNVTNLDVVRNVSTNSLWSITRPIGYIYTNNVKVNGIPRANFGGGLQTGWATSTDINSTFGEFVGALSLERTAGGTSPVTAVLPDSSVWGGYIKIVANQTTSKLAFVTNGNKGQPDTLQVGQSAFYSTDGSAKGWMLIGKGTVSTSSGGTITLTGDITGSGTGSISTTIGSNVVTYSKMQQVVATSVIGRSANSTGNVGAISASADGETLRRVGGVLGFGLLPWASITNVPNYYFTNPNLSDTNLVKLNDSTFLIKADRAPDTSVVKHTDTTVFFKLQSGLYSPSRSDPTNVTSSSVESFFFERNGKVVGFSGTLKVTPTSASPSTTALDLALPLSPTFTATTDLGASGSVTTPAVTGNSWTFLINGRTSNGTARVSFTSTGNTEHVIFITGRFELK